MSVEQIPPKYAPDGYDQNLWSAYLAQNFPKLWEKYHERPVFLPGEPVGVFGPTSYYEACIWSEWEKKYGSELGTNNQTNDQASQTNDQTSQTNDQASGNNLDLGDGCLSPLINGLMYHIGDYSYLISDLTSRVKTILTS